MNERRVGGLWCHEVLELLDVYVAGQLTPTQLTSVQAHTSVCDACARFGGSYARLVAALQDAQPEALDESRTARLLVRLQAEQA